MNVIYSDQKIIVTNAKSLFLAGPTPRNNECTSWRIEALDILANLNFEGVVYVPESKTKISYNQQVEWEYEALHCCDIIIFWIPRSDQLPGFTTNVEFGFWLKSNKISYGRPNNSIKNKYLDWIYKKETANNPFTNLRLLLIHSIDKITLNCKI